MARTERIKKSPESLKGEVNCRMGRKVRCGPSNRLRGRVGSPLGRCQSLAVSTYLLRLLHTHTHTHTHAHGQGFAFTHGRN